MKLFRKILRGKTSLNITNVPGFLICGMLLIIPVACFCLAKYAIPWLSIFYGDYNYDPPALVSFGFGTVVCIVLLWRMRMFTLRMKVFVTIIIFFFAIIWLLVYYFSDFLPSRNVWMPEIEIAETRYYQAKTKKVITRQQIYRDNAPAVVMIEGRDKYDDSTGGGSGFLINEDGLILTNYHLLPGAPTIIVRLQNEEEFKASLVLKHKERDIALLKIYGKEKFPYVILGNSDDLMIGDDILTVGNPILFRNSLTPGVVSGLNRKNLDEEFIQVTIPLAKGNSGGPVFNMYGEVIGIAAGNWLPYEEARPVIGFAIPINEVIKLLPYPKPKLE
ncbi:MAG: trypsin-like peptidase domain-containing protein [Candidatus Omnitrophota bacterium]